MKKIVVCDECEGEGFVEYICPECNGLVAYEYWGFKIICNCKTGSIYDICPKCLGEGYLETIEEKEEDEDENEN